MTTVNVTIEGGRVHLSAPYTPEMPPKARALDGRWDAGTKHWTFDSRDEQRVRDLAREIYGTDGGDTGEVVTVHVVLGKIDADWGPDSRYPSVVTWLGRRLAYRPGRDNDVVLTEGVRLIAGQFDRCGKSMRYPTIGNVDGVVLEIRDMPKDAVNRIRESEGDAVTVVEERINGDELAAERERLLARVAEINALIGE